jgi:hypothetical protein
MMPTRAQEAQAVRPRGWGQGYGDCVPLMPAPHTGLIEQILLLSQQLCVLLIVLGGLLGTATMNVLLQLWSSACWRQAVPHWLLAPWTWQWPAQHMGACSRALTANTKPCVAGASAGGGGGGFVWANGITVTPGQGYTVTVGAGGTGPGRAGGNSWFISEATMVARGGGGGQKAGGAAGTFALGTGVTGAGFIGGIGGEAVGLSHPGRQQVTTCVVGLDGKLLHLSHPCVPVGQTSSCGTVCLGQGREDEFCLADSTAGSCTPPHMPMVAVLAIRTVLRHSGSPLSPLVSTHSPPPHPRRPGSQHPANHHHPQASSHGLRPQETLPEVVVVQEGMLEPAAKAAPHQSSLTPAPAAVVVVDGTRHSALEEEEAALACWAKGPTVLQALLPLWVVAVGPVAAPVLLQALVVLVVVVLAAASAQATSTRRVVLGAVGSSGALTVPTPAPTLVTCHPLLLLAAHLRHLALRVRWCLIRPAPSPGRHLLA